jgi:hypothetical protein
MNHRRSPAFVVVLALLAGCGADAPAPAPAPAAPSAAAAPGVDWDRCRIPSVKLPVAGRLFVVDGGPAAPGAEPGRESIRRVDVFVPGPVALLLTARDATAWHVRLGPETKLQAVFATGEASQRITGQGLGDARLEKSAAYGDACGRYWLADGEAALVEVTRRAFGRPHDALYRMRTGLVIIGGPESFEPDSLGPER